MKAWTPDRASGAALQTQRLAQHTPEQVAAVVAGGVRATRVRAHLVASEASDASEAPDSGAPRAPRARPCRACEWCATTVGSGARGPPSSRATGRKSSSRPSIDALSDARSVGALSNKQSCCYCESNEAERRRTRRSKTTFT